MLHVRASGVGKAYPLFIYLFFKEGCFSVSLRESKKSSNWNVQFTFRIGVHSSEIELLKRIQSFFGGIGRIGITSTKNEAFFIISSKVQLIKFLKHFDTYPL